MLYEERVGKNVDKQRIERALKEVARKNGVNVEEVRHEIEQAVNLSKMEKLSVEEVLEQLAKRVEERMS